MKSAQTTQNQFRACCVRRALGASLMRQRTKPGLKDLKEAIAHVLGGSLVAGKPLFSNP